MVFDVALHHEIHRITGADEHAMDFLFQRRFLKTPMPCRSCSANMTLVACPEFKSSDLLIWYCSPCRKFKKIRADQES